MKTIALMDLFAGCGGLSLGLSNAGISAKWAVETNVCALSAYQLRHEETKCISLDAGEVLDRMRSKDSSLPRKGDVDVLAGGPPCQGFCGINRHRKWSDPRNSLVEVFFDYIEYLMPRIVLMENVTGILTLENGLAINNLQYSLAELGYNVSLFILQAGNYGVPQNRWRVFVLANLKGTKPQVPKFLHTFPKITPFDVGDFKRDICFGAVSSTRNLELDFSEKILDPVNVKDAISDLPIIENGEKYVGKRTTARQSQYQKMLAGGDEIYDHETVLMGDLNLSRVSAIEPGSGGGWQQLPEQLQPQNLSKLSRPRYEHRFGRLKWDGIFNTILQAPHPYWGRVFHPEQSRLISVRECARAQGFPDDFRFNGAMREKYRQVGNAVPPPLARSLGWEIRRCLGDKSVNSEIERYGKSFTT